MTQLEKLLAMNNLSVIIPAINCQEILNKTIGYLRKDVDPLILDIVVVDDGSDIHLTVPDGVTLVRHDGNRGVGAAFDTGVKHAKHNNLVLMGSDIIVPEGWCSKALDLLQDYPLSILCSICSSFSDVSEPFRDSRRYFYGAHILKTTTMKLEEESIPDILQAEWNMKEPDWKGEPVSEIGCIYGAFYLTTKMVYNAIGGWMGHKYWGGLEPMISIRAKRSGYKLYLTRDIETAHFFGYSRRGARMDVYFYNKLMMAHTMFEDTDWAWEHLMSMGGNVPAWVALRSMEQSGIMWLDIREFHRQNWVNGLIKAGEQI